MSRFIDKYLAILHAVIYCANSRHDILLQIQQNYISLLNKLFKYKIKLYAPAIKYIRMFSIKISASCALRVYNAPKLNYENATIKLL